MLNVIDTIEEALKAMEMMISYLERLVGSVRRSVGGRGSVRGRAALIVSPQGKD